MFKYPILGVLWHPWFITKNSSHGINRSYCQYRTAIDMFSLFENYFWQKILVLLHYLYIIFKNIPNIPSDIVLIYIAKLLGNGPPALLVLPLKPQQLSNIVQSQTFFLGKVAVHLMWIEASLCHTPSSWVTVLWLVICVPPLISAVRYALSHKHWVILR